MNKRKSIILGVLALFGLCFWVYMSEKGLDDNKPRILINQLVEHEALNQTVKGIIDALADFGFVHKKNAEIRIESAQANAALAAQISAKFVNQRPDIVIGVATISAQSLSKYAIDQKVKLIFSTVTDPLGAKLVESLKQPMNNTSGVSNFVALEPQLELFIKLKPGMKRLGFLYNPGELNSVSLMERLSKLCPQYNLSLVKLAANKTSEIPQAAIKIANSCDAIFISNDNTALSAMPSIIKAGNQAKIPVFVSDTDMVKLGAVAALGPNQYQVGRQTGEMAIRVLKGADINQEPVEFPKATYLYLNLLAAKNADIVIPSDVLASATNIIDEDAK